MMRRIGAQAQGFILAATQRATATTTTTTETVQTDASCAWAGCAPTRTSLNTLTSCVSGVRVGASGASVGPLLSSLRYFSSSRAAGGFLRTSGFAGVDLDSGASLRTVRRSVAQHADAKTFETDIVQSQLAVVVIYYIPTSGCNAFIKQAESLVDKMNSQTTATWLKLCVINSDENRNLASAFSVQRAQLPVTYFIMQSTIIDKLSGHVSEQRLEGVLRKFLEHYQTQLNVDLIGGSSSTPGTILPAAATADLLHGSSTQFLQKRILASLVGPEMIQLPEESPMLDGLRKTIQQAKKMTHDELQELHRELGIDIRRMSDSDMNVKYYQSEQFKAFALLSALEALFLARAHSSVGDMAAENVVFALRAIQTDFEQAMGDQTMKRVVSLCEVNLVKGDAKLELMKWERRLIPDTSAEETAAAEEEKAAAIEHYSQVLAWIDQYIDARGLPEEFPSATVDKMLAALRKAVATQKKVTDGKKRVDNIKTCIMGVIHAYPTDQRSAATLSRLTSILY